jgi:oligosaccharide repeat unit polymerase
VDMTLVLTGTSLAVFASVMMLIYLWFERGSIFDPISVSWIGYIVFIAIAMIGTGVLYPERDTAGRGTMGCVLMALGTAMYVAGLYCGRELRLARWMPRPRADIGKSQIWLAWFLSLVTLPLYFVALPVLYSITGDSASLYLYTTMGSASLVGLIGVIMLRGSPFSRIFMALTVAVCCFAMLTMLWSRRPLAGVLIAIVGLIYHFRIARRSALVKLWYVGGLAVSTMILIGYLEASRGARFYAAAAEHSVGTFTTENLRGLFAGIEINYRTYEYTLEHFPSSHPYLYGTGYVPGICWWPRALWPSKPVSTAYVVSQMWLNKETPEWNLGLPTMGEAYANFGVIGIIVVLFLVGRIIRLMNSYLLVNTNNIILWGAWLTIIADVATEWRGDFTSMTAQAIYKIMGFLLVMWVSSLFVRQRKGPLAQMPNNARFRPVPQMAWNGRTRPIALPQRPSV